MCTSRHAAMPPTLSDHHAADVPSVCAQALVRWGGALLELAHYKQGQESIEMIQLVREGSRTRRAGAGRGGGGTGQGPGSVRWDTV